VLAPSPGEFGVPQEEPYDHPMVREEPPPWAGPPVEPPKPPMLDAHAESYALGHALDWLGRLDEAFPTDTPIVQSWYTPIHSKRALLDYWRAKRRMVTPPARNDLRDLMVLFAKYAPENVMSEWEDDNLERVRRCELGSRDFVRSLYRKALDWIGAWQRYQASRGDSAGYARTSEEAGRAGEAYDRLVLTL
jgi:hypothetical protein